MTRCITFAPVALALALLSACGSPGSPGGSDVIAEAEPPPEILGGVVAATDGVPIVYDAQGAGEPALVFIHCWACDRTFWKEQIAAFTARHRVVTLDLPGHGESGNEREDWSVAGLADDVRTLVDALDLERVILVGHSMGGPVALLAAPLLKERVLGVACIDTLHDAEMEWDAEAAAPIIHAFEQDFAGANGQIVPMLFPQGADPALVEWVTARANAVDHAAATSLLADFPNLDTVEMMTAAGVPIRCVNAAPLGQMIPATATESNRAHADFDAVIVEGVGHYLQLERPREVNERLTQVVAELTALDQ